MVLTEKNAQRIIEQLERLSPRRIYELGWRAAADWADRDDLVSDIGSPAYEREMREAFEKASRAMT